jgi:hypothetical protein
LWISVLRVRGKGVITTGNYRKYFGWPKSAYGLLLRLSVELRTGLRGVLETGFPGLDETEAVGWGAGYREA